MIEDDPNGCDGQTWNEAERVAALKRYEILDTPTESRFDDIAEVAAEICDAPIAVVNFVGSDRQWFKAEIGIGQRELPLDVSICRHALLQPGLFVIPDLTKDPRFEANPLVALEDGLRFYAGALLETPEGVPIGTVCVLDRAPRPQGLTHKQSKVLANLARQVMAELELRRQVSRSVAELEALKLATERAAQAAALAEAIGAAAVSPTYAKDVDGRVIYANPALLDVLGLPLDAVLGRSNQDLVAKEDADAYSENDRVVLQAGQTLVAEEQVTAADGRRRVFRTHKVPLRNADGDIVGLVGVSVDLTEERERQTELEAANRLLDAVLEALPVGVIIADATGRIVRDNKANRELWGVPPETTSWAEYGEWVGFWPDSGERIKADEWAMSRALLRGEVVRGEMVECERFDTAEHRFYLNNAAPVRDAAGAIVGGVVAELDVTEQVCGERALARRSEQLQALAEAALRVAQAATLEERIDEITASAQRLIWAKQAVVSLTQGPDWRQAITSFRLSAPYEAWSAYDTPTDGSGIYSLVCETNRPVRLTQRELEAHPRWRGFGSHAAEHPPMRGWLAAPLVASDGRNLGLIQLSDKDDGGDFDPTDEAVLVQLAQVAAASLEQGIVEAALRASEAKFQAIADSVDQMIWAATSDGAHDYFNSRWYAFTGVPIGSTDGEGWRDLFHPDDQAKITERWSHSLATGELYEIEYRLRHHSGQYRWVLGRATPIRGLEGQIERWYGTCTDIHELRSTQDALHELNTSLEARVQAAVAERQRVEDALRQSQKMEAVGQLTGGIAHDFNNLLTIIAGNLDLATRASSRDDRQRLERAIGNARHGAERAAALTHRLLAFSRSRPALAEIINPAQLVTGMKDLLDRALGELVELTLDVEPQGWNTYADASQLESAVLNLAVNARDAMPAGGRLIVRVHNSRRTAEEHGTVQDYICVEVSDTGTGMEPDIAARVFEPFFTTKETGKGTGLGLSMVYGFVRQSDGHVEVDTAPGSGTTFRLLLPRKEGQRSNKEALRDADERDLAGLRVLVVEDDDDVRAFTSECLTQLGCAVQTAANGGEALQLLARSGTLDVLLTDVVMPGLSGPQLVERAKTQWPDLRVIFTSGYLPEGFDGSFAEQPVLSKPFTISSLADALRVRRH